MGPLPFAPAIALFEAWCRRSREVLRDICGLFEAKAELGGFSWWEKAPFWLCRGGGGSWRRWGVSRSVCEFGWLMGEKAAMITQNHGTPGECSGGSERSLKARQESGEGYR